MSKSEAKIQAQRLRKKGFALNDIARQLGVSKSSVAAWVREIALTEAQLVNLRNRMVAGGHAGRMRGAHVNKQKRIERLNVLKSQATKSISSMKFSDFFFLGLGLYWGEGNKSRTTSSAGFSNSDARVVALMLSWFQYCLDVSRERFRVQIFIDVGHRDREDVITQYWLETTALPVSQFRRIIYLNKSKKVYENRDSYYGVCAVRVLNGTELRDKILALISRSYDIHAQCFAGRGSSVG